MASATSIKELSSSKCFGGHQKVFNHHSAELKCAMNFAVYLPPQADKEKVPVVYWLSGLTCTEQNFIVKSGFQRYAADHGLLVVAVDTSPRGCGVEGEDDSYDIGTGAGFYIDATQEKWKEHYRMYSYVTKEIPNIIHTNFPVLPNKQAISGHSMGGHGALVCALKNPGMYVSVSAFAPISNPTQCSWGQKALATYIGNNTEEWKNYDATCLIEKYSGPSPNILIDQGSEDEFLKDSQLLPENFCAAAAKKGITLSYRLQQGYDHSYYFVASFLEDHLRHHSKHLHL